jgi:hypothetical protein
MVLGGCRVTLVVVPSRWCRPAQIAVIAPAANRMLREAVIAEIDILLAARARQLG